MSKQRMSDRAFKLSCSGVLAVVVVVAATLIYWGTRPMPNPIVDAREDAAKVCSPTQLHKVSSLETHAEVKEVGTFDFSEEKAKAARQIGPGADDGPQVSVTLRYTLEQPITLRFVFVEPLNGVGKIRPTPGAVGRGSVTLLTKNYAPVGRIFQLLICASPTS